MKHHMFIFYNLSAGNFAGNFPAGNHSAGFYFRVCRRRRAITISPTQAIGSASARAPKPKRNIFFRKNEALRYVLVLPPAEGKLPVYTSGKIISNDFFPSGSENWISAPASKTPPISPEEFPREIRKRRFPPSLSALKIKRSFLKGTVIRKFPAHERGLRRMLLFGASGWYPANWETMFRWNPARLQA